MREMSSGATGAATVLRAVRQGVMPAKAKTGKKKPAGRKPAKKRHERVKLGHIEI
jgi:hypothetical protein